MKEGENISSLSLDLKGNSKKQNQWVPFFSSIPMVYAYGLHSKKGDQEARREVGRDPVELKELITLVLFSNLLLTNKTPENIVWMLKVNLFQLKLALLLHYKVHTFDSTVLGLRKISEIKIETASKQPNAKLESSMYIRRNIFSYVM